MVRVVCRWVPAVVVVAFSVSACTGGDGSSSSSSSGGGASSSSAAPATSGTTSSSSVLPSSSAEVSSSSSSAVTSSSAPPSSSAEVSSSTSAAPSSSAEVSSSSSAAPSSSAEVSSSSSGPADGTPCDDGLFCTLGDAYEHGVCVGHGTNDCGLPANPCQAYNCDEGSHSCGALPIREGQSCTPVDKCTVDGLCHFGECQGVPRDCSTDPLAECNAMMCDPATGACLAMPDVLKDGAPCQATGDVCRTGKACAGGLCQGGAAKDCSMLDRGCQVAFCSPADGSCQASTLPDGHACSDLDACTGQDHCNGGTCTGTPVAGCTAYLQARFDLCPEGWTLAGDWQCGVPSSVGPVLFSGGVLATQLSGTYSVNQSFPSAVADSPPINLTPATHPMLSFWAWQQTEGGTADGWNLHISSNGGASFTELTTVTPAYDLTVQGQPAWGGDHAAEGWRNYQADLSAWSGQVVILRFAFSSDGATVFPGVYVDDLVVAEPLQIPLAILTSPVLPDAVAGLPVVVGITATGGSGAASWSIPAEGGPAWLSVDPVSGVLSGTPGPADVGPVSVTLHLEEPMVPSNRADKTFAFNVLAAAYASSFEGFCPGGWTLTGDWQCGTPMNVGPARAFSGTQCLGTQLAGNYSDMQSYAGCSATSPDVDLSGWSEPHVAFRMWVDTEGSTYDGFHLEVSTDGGQNFTVLEAVSPAYSLSVAGQPAWGGHQAALGWQHVQGDLSAYEGQTIRLRFAFHSDSSGNFPGVYIDDVLVR